MFLQRITIKNFRSISNLTVNFREKEILTLTGANNVGKTNFLRALDLFFSLDVTKFEPENDIPFDIVEGTAGGGLKTRFEALLIEKEDTYDIVIEFKRDKTRGKYIDVKKALKNRTKISSEEAFDTVKSIRFVLIQSSNVNLPELIAAVVDREILPSLDSKRSKQTKALEDLKKFIDSAQKAVIDIERSLWDHLSDFVGDIDNIDTKEWKVKVLFPEFSKLREAITDLVELTIYDKNDRKIDSKGSGIQWLLLISIIKHLTTSNNYSTILAIDEPEAFLQPVLQKRIFKVLNGIASSNANTNLILTTHSPHLIDLNNIDHTHLFIATHEPRPIKRRNNQIFYKTKTAISNKNGFEKIDAIKNQLGIERNDSWNIMPKNLMVEGEADKKYLITLLNYYGFQVPNILSSGGTGKTNGYLQFLKEFCEDLNLRPKPIIKAIFDNDNAGKSQYDSICSSAHNFKTFTISAELLPRVDGLKDRNFDYEIEDFIYPELMFEAINKILNKKKGYKKVYFKAPKRFSPAYDKGCILKYINEEVKHKNPSLPQLDFEADGLKNYLCSLICETIEKKGIDPAIDAAYPEVKKYLMKISL